MVFTTEKVRPTGISFPFRVGPKEFPKKATSAELWEDMIQQVLLLPIGSRVRRRSIGSKLRNFVHRPVNELTRELIKDEVVRAITKHLPEIELIDITVDKETMGDSAGFGVDIVFRTPEDARREISIDVS